MAATMIESFFQRSLEDMVKGLRVQFVGEAKYLAKALEEVKREIKSTDASTKAVALQKLTYLHMLQGTDMDWAAFHVVEVMSMQRFSLRKVGYLAASQSFSERTDVLLLITNLMKKDLGGNNEYETALALECLSKIVTPDLARDLTPDIFNLLASGRAFVRKKATVALLRVFMQYPDAIRVAFKRLVEKLSDSDPSVVTAAVSVLCELTLKDPKPYLPLAPEFYKLLVGSPSNWLAIKLMKIFGALAPLEPRLGRKLAEPLCELMRKNRTKTGAKSLLLECINTVTVGLAQHEVAVKLCVENLNELMRDDDHNLKYLGLRALANLMSAHPWAVIENKDVITDCLSHEDPGIQKGSLRLIIGMVSDANVTETVQVLLQQAHKTDPTFCNELLRVILSTCSADQYDLISDFTWYLSVLVEMARIPRCDQGEEIGRQLIDIGFRVKSVTADVLKAGRELVLDPALVGLSSFHGVLAAAAWITGEYVAFSHNPYELIEGLLQPRTKLLPASVRAIYIQAVLKIFVSYASRFYKHNLSDAGFAGSHDNDGSGNLSAPVSTSTTGKSWVSSTNAIAEGSLDAHGEGAGLQEGNISCSTRVENTMELQPVNQEDYVIKEEPQMVVGSLSALVKLIMENVRPMVHSADVEVQERASNLVGVLQFFKDVPGLGSLSRLDSRQFSGIKAMLDALEGVFNVEMGPVSRHAQGRVVAPEGLIIDNLDVLGPLQNQEITEGSTDREGQREWEDGTLFTSHSKRGVGPQVDESAALLAQHRLRHENFYLPTGDGLPAAHVDATALPSTSGGYVPPVDSSLGWTKPRRAKVRPVVVKLDGEEEHSKLSSKLKMKDLKDDFISSAIRDVLAGDSRSSNKHHTPTLGDEVRESGKVRPHRPRGIRTSRHAERENSFKDQASATKRDELCLERDANLSSGNDSNTASASKKPDHTKSLSKHRQSRHGRRVMSSNDDEEERSDAVKSPRKTQGKSKTRRSGRHRANSPSHKINYSTPDWLSFKIESHVENVQQ